MVYIGQLKSVDGVFSQMQGKKQYKYKLLSQGNLFFFTDCCNALLSVFVFQPKDGEHDRTDPESAAVSLFAEQVKTFFNCCCH